MDIYDPKFSSSMSVGKPHDHNYLLSSYLFDRASLYFTFIF